MWEGGRWWVECVWPYIKGKQEGGAPPQNPLAFLACVPPNDPPFVALTCTNHTLTLKPHVPPRIPCTGRGTISTVRPLGVMAFQVFKADLPPPATPLQTSPSYLRKLNATTTHTAI